ncbi:polysaccharide biosynthesis tyrosine autokinase [Leifsonia sp. F6_8S_P_1B]|uniref:Polysaccharide biosynthesis tyrosine autokinase n=1 Tax=Leifsonia williamsii TaxID=3035919 RepID=A0ABT8KF50_9MICO|nr:polysaccharide biosynthesis tyrosine autokinase [Leifsonia williamsii]MDN4616085.1 polysaccharide biosynthesis tyrosine autokinase [Leifsonia williamsii]
MPHREPDQPRALSLREYLRITRRYAAGMLSLVLVAVLAAAAWTVAQPRVYSSTAAGLVQSQAGDDLNSAYEGDSLAKSRAASYVQQAASIEVAKLVIEQLKLPMSPGALAASVSAQQPTDTAIIRITADADTPEDAQRIANAWIAALGTRIAQLESPDGSADAAAGGGAGVTRFSTLASAPLNPAPSSPNVPVTLALAFVVGLFLAALYALTRHQLDRGVRSADVIESAFGVPVVGTIPLTDDLTRRSRILEDGSRPVTGPTIGTMEALRELRTNLSYVDVDEPPRVLLVTSSLPGEGKSTLASNLATTIARSGQPVVVVDADMRRPNQVATFGLPDTAGLSDVLAGRVALRDVLQDPGLSPNLRVLAAGRTPPNPSELLGSRTMRELLVALSELALVIVDAPPLLPVTDAAVLSRSVDGVLLVVDARRTKVDQLGKALKSLQHAGGRLTGVVLNRVPRRGSDAISYGYYGSEYGYGYTSPAPLTDGRDGDARGGAGGAAPEAGQRAADTATAQVPTMQEPPAGPIAQEAAHQDPGPLAPAAPEPAAQDAAPREYATHEHTAYGAAAQGNPTDEHTAHGPAAHERTAHVPTVDEHTAPEPPAYEPASAAPASEEPASVAPASEDPASEEPEVDRLTSDVPTGPAPVVDGAAAAVESDPVLARADPAAVPTPVYAGVPTAHGRRSARR